MDTPRTDRVRTVRLPRTVPLIEPISSVEAGFFASARFFMRIGVFGVVALCVFAILGLRLWSLQVLQGPRYVQLATQQTFRYVDLPRRAGRDRRRARAAARGRDGRARRHRRPELARQGERARRLAAELGGQADPRPPGARRPAVGPRPGAGGAAREAHPPRARPLALRACGRAPAPDDAGLALPRRARARLSRPARRLAAAALVPAGRARRRVPRPARRGRADAAEGSALPRLEAGRGRRAVRRRARTTTGS